MLLNFIIEVDHHLLYLINEGMSSDFLDNVVPWLRNDKFWLPLYVFLFSFLIFNFGRKAYWFIVFVVLTASAADIISSRVVKPLIQRERPCRSAELNFEVRQLVHCGSGYSFTSSHATNHFAVATFISMVLGRFFRRISILLYFWAGIVAFAQVYVGVHYPTDVIGGAILGIIIAKMTALLYQKFYGNRLISNQV